jgi:hypothetical protein
MTERLPILLCALFVLFARHISNPLIAQLLEYFDRTFDALSDNELKSATISLESACRVDSAFPVSSGIRLFYSTEISTVAPSETLATAMTLGEDEPDEDLVKLDSLEDRLGRIRYAPNG